METAIQRIEHDGSTYAIIVRNSLPFDGYNFVSRDEEELQIGVNHYEAGVSIKPHYHLPQIRELRSTIEVLHIDSGRVALKLFDKEQRLFFESSMQGGDTIVLLGGGHSLDVLEKTRIVEVKQGPYLGPEKDKKVFEPR